MGVTYYSASALRATAGIPIPTPAPPLPHRASEECGWQCSGCRATNGSETQRCIWCRSWRIGVHAAPRASRIEHVRVVD